MNIRTKFILIGVFSLVAIFSFGGFVFYTSLSSASIGEREASSWELVVLIFERNLYLSDYVLNKTAHSYDQIIAKDNEIKDILLDIFSLFDADLYMSDLLTIQKHNDAISFDIEKLLFGGLSADRDLIAVNSERVKNIFFQSQYIVDLAHRIASESSAKLILLREQVIYSILVFGFFGVMFASISIIIIFQSTSSLFTLEKGMSKIASGDLLHRVKTKNKDEVGRMATMFNSMAEKLQESQSILEHKIKERTSELRETLERIKKQNTELEGGRLASLNILEDLDNEKKRLSEIMVRDDAMLQSIGEGIVAIDIGRHVFMANAMAMNIVGLSADTDFIGKIWPDDFVKFTTEKGEELTKALLPSYIALRTKQRSVNTTECILIRKNGKKIHVSIVSSPILLEGEPIGAVVAMRDNTRERKIEKSKTEFVSIASHQLRTPMAGIQWVVERLQKTEKLSERGAGYVSDIHTSVVRLSAMVDLLLNVSRIEGGRVAVNPKPLELVHYLKSFLEEITPLCDKKSLKVVFEKHPEELQVRSDTSVLRNIVQSLVSNAIEYTPDGGDISITLETIGENFLLAIGDTGIGIPKQEQATIFTKFTRASNAKQVKADGTGLGLHIAFEATALLDGKIWFESEGEGQGTTFFVRLPLDSKPRQGEKTLT